MKKNGFTLIELIATIGLLGMLATILITVSIKKINETKEHSKKTMIESIELAAKEYVTDYKDKLADFQNNDYIYISLQTLVEKNYFSNSLIDPTTNKSLPLTDTVYVTREQNGEINATYDINQKEKAKITLNGSYNEYIKEGTTFTDLGVNAISSDGTNISSSITTTGTVDTTTPGTYKIKYEYGNISIERNVIVYEGNLPSTIFINYNANEGTFGTTKYDYTGGEQTFIVPKDGYYKLEVWGAQGGNAGTYQGGYGGYSSGKIKLKKSQVIYINVGGSGSSTSSGVLEISYGGYNGGGDAGGQECCERIFGSGGGATHIATYSGILQALEKIRDSIIIVAGGGGGSYYGTNAGTEGLLGGSGGGYIGGNGTESTILENQYCAGLGGTQTFGGRVSTVCNYTNYYNGMITGSFGLGGSDCNSDTGGGGGYYGGSRSGHIAPAGGGSGYIGNSLLTDKYMYCYNCSTSSETNTKTYTTTDVSDTPISNYAKSGNGAAIISQITYEQKSSYLSTYPINSIPVPTRDGYTFNGWFTEPVGGTQVTSSTIINIQTAHELYAHWEVAS